jgi:hypothetical protein
LARLTPVSNGHLAACTATGHHGIVDWAQVATIVAAIGAFTSMQAFWIARALDGLSARIDRLDTRMDRLDTRMDRL